MIKQLKLGFQMMRYTFGVKMCLILAAICFVLGLLVEFLPAGASITGALLLMVCGLWAAQLVYSLGVSDMIKTSKYAKAMETGIPTLVSFLLYLICYVIIIAFKLPRLSGASEESMQYMVGEILTSGIMAAMLMIFCAIAYKLFAIATVLFLVMFFVLNVMVNSGGLFMVDVSFGAAVIIGFVLLVVGALLQYGISLLVYKVPLSKSAQLRGLQKYM